MCLPSKEAFLSPESKVQTKAKGPHCVLFLADAAVLRCCVATVATTARTPPRVQNRKRY